MSDAAQAALARLGRDAAEVVAVMTPGERAVLVAAILSGRYDDMDGRPSYLDPADFVFESDHTDRLMTRALSAGYVGPWGRRRAALYLRARETTAWNAGPIPEPREGSALLVLQQERFGPPVLHAYLARVADGDDALRWWGMGAEHVWLDKAQGPWLLVAVPPLPGVAQP